MQRKPGKHRHIRKGGLVAEVRPLTNALHIGITMFTQKYSWYQAFLVFAQKLTLWPIISTFDVSNSEKNCVQYAPEPQQMDSIQYFGADTAVVTETIDGRYSKGRILAPGHIYWSAMTDEESSLVAGQRVRLLHRIGNTWLVEALKQ